MGNRVSDSERKNYHISVRNLVEFIFREGDIDNRHGGGMNAEAMQEGSRIHRLIQGEWDKDYQAEVPLKETISLGEYDLTIEGRADGIFLENNRSGIEEIKGVTLNLDKLEEPIYVHKAQALCYAYMFASQNQLEHIEVLITYCHMESMERKYFRSLHTCEELKAWFMNTVESYRKWSDFQFFHERERQASIRGLSFPFEYREGQKELVKNVYYTIAQSKIMFLQAPTGVGKTISTIYPAVQAMGQGKGERIFYLTAKTITASVARETFELLADAGYVSKTISLTAKEKMCLCEEMECNPVHCPYAKGHFDRVNDATYDVISSGDFFYRETILDYARKHMVCPFELGLDVSLWCDDIICDYNYAFDPRAKLKRFFGEGKGDYILLVDEAHNLVERSRKMYSATLVKEHVLCAKRIIKPYSKKIEKSLDSINKKLLTYKRECENYVEYDEIGTLYFSLMRLHTQLDEFLDKPLEFAGKKELLDFYFEVHTFLTIYDLVDEHYVIYTQLNEAGEFELNLFCVDPSQNLQACLDNVRATVFFSATLLPVNYYKSLLCTEANPYAVYAQSAFSPEQQMILVGTDVSTKYTKRTEQQFVNIATYIERMVASRKGNYMVFFPSYKLMQQVYEKYVELSLVTECIVQKTGMTETEREEFLERFTEKTDGTLVGFCVMGGIFGEGIDLKKDALIGVCVVGTGLPQVCNEREILKRYYDDRLGTGFAYAYTYPGFNKVLQAAGRVIRTVEDRGVVLLLDERFNSRDYDALYPREWSHRKNCRLSNVSDFLEGFWEEL